MFKIGCFVEDRHLAIVMHALGGYVHDLTVVPVVNAVPTKSGKVQAKHNGSSVEQFYAVLKKAGKVEFNSNDAKEACKEIGVSPGSKNYMISKAVAAKLVKKKPGSTSQNTVWLLLNEAGK